MKTTAITLALMASLSGAQELPMLAPKAKRSEPEWIQAECIKAAEEKRARKLAKEMARRARRLELL